MLRKALFGLLAGAALAAPAAAQTVDEVIAKHVEARGGLDKIKAVQSMRMTGKMTVGPGIEAPISLEMKRPASVRLDITFQGNMGTQAYDGKTGWGISPMSAKKDPEPMSAEDIKDMEEQGDMDGPPVLVALREKEPLLLYISASPQLISAALIVERDETSARRRSPIAHSPCSDKAGHCKNLGALRQARVEMAFSL